MDPLVHHPLSTYEHKRDRGKYRERERERETERDREQERGKLWGVPARTGHPA